MSARIAPIARRNLSSSAEWRAQEQSLRPSTIVGNIVLMQGWTSDNPDRTFANQTFEIRAQTKCSRIGRDGRLIVTCRPMNVTWYGGRAEYLKDVMRVKIVTRGHVLIDESLDAQGARSKAVQGGLSFDLTSQP